MFHKKERQALSGVLNGSEARSRRAILAKKSFDYAAQEGTAPLRTSQYSVSGQHRRSGRPGQTNWTGLH
jgi:hypothetical protein